MAEDAETFDFGIESEGGMEETEVAAEEVADEGIAEEAPQEAESEGEPAEAGEAPEEVPPFFTFKLGDGREKTFANADEANQYFSTWNGRLAKQAEVLKDFQQENQRWAEYYEANRELIEAAQKAEKETKPEEAMNLLKAADWEYVNQLYARGDSTKAMQYLAFKTNEHVNSVLNDRLQGIEAKYEAQLGPMREQEQVRNATVELLDAARKSADEYGNPTFPEFQDGSPTFDAEFVSTFGSVLKNLPVRIALDPDGHGIMLAYDRTHRIMAGRQKEQTTKVDNVTAAATERARDANGRFLKQTEAQATAIGGSPGRTPSTERASNEAMTTAEFKRAMTNAGKRDDFLGVEFE